MLTSTQRMDRRPSLRLHLHPAHRSRNRLLVRARSTSMDIPRNSNLQIDILDPVLRHRHGHNSGAKSHYLRSGLAILEILASSWNGSVSRHYTRSAHLRRSRRPQVPPTRTYLRRVVGEQDVPQRRGVGSERCAVVFARTVERWQGMRRTKTRTFMMTCILRLQRHFFLFLFRRS